MPAFDTTPLSTAFQLPNGGTCYVEIHTPIRHGQQAFGIMTCVGEDCFLSLDSIDLAPLVDPQAGPLRTKVHTFSTVQCGAQEDDAMMGGMDFSSADAGMLIDTSDSHADLPTAGPASGLVKPADLLQTLTPLTDSSSSWSVSTASSSDKHPCTFCAKIFTTSDNCARHERDSCKFLPKDRRVEVLVDLLIKYLENQLRRSDNKVATVVRRMIIAGQNCDGDIFVPYMAGALSKAVKRFRSLISGADAVSNDVASNEIQDLQRKLEVAIRQAFEAALEREQHKSSNAAGKRKVVELPQTAAAESWQPVGPSDHAAFQYNATDEVLFGGMPSDVHARPSTLAVEHAFCHDGDTAYRPPQNLEHFCNVAHDEFWDELIQDGAWETDSSSPF